MTEKPEQCPVCGSHRTQPLRGRVSCEDCGRITKIPTFNEFLDAMIEHLRDKEKQP